MHFKIKVFIIISMNFFLIFTQRLESKHETFKSEIINSKNTDLPDTPSPEWIKYQQERFEHNIKSQILQDHKEQKIKTYGQNKNPYDPEKHESEINSKPFDKIETTSRHRQNNHEQNEEEEVIENTEEPNDSTSSSENGVQFPSIQGFIEFLKSIKQTWMKNSLFRIDDKIKMLYNLKDSLMKTIEKQFMVLWQDDDEDEEDDVDVGNDAETSVDKNFENLSNDQHHQHIRHKRGILDESNINFPPDAALMSINFLTFSVFLIKLVLQVVHIIKSKHYQLSTFNMTDTGAIRYRG